MKNRVIKVDQLARVEGEGALHIRIKNGEVADVQLNIFEPPRFFEAFLRGRMFSEAPDITARICGICPVAYQMSAVHAMEDAFGVTVDGQLRELRRLLYCGEWIESHVLHMFLLHAPDFLGYEDAIELSRDHRDLVERALKLKKIGNGIVALLGGREIHPINVRVGGFYKVPSKKELLALVDDLSWSRDTALEFASVLAGLDFPDFEQDYEFVSLQHPTEYPMNEGRFVSTSGLDISVKEYEFHFQENQVRHSNALHSREKGIGRYHVGPMARFNLNYNQLSPLARKVSEEIGLVPPVKNPFRSIAVRCVETVYALGEALRIIANYEMPEAAAVPIQPVAGTGFGATEAPRGTLYHRYKIGDDGLITDAKIVPPTSQNQETIENDLREFVGRNIDLSKDELTRRCEQAVRNYDPCISCATHFLTLTTEEVS